MSIIVDALQKLQDNNFHSSAFEPGEENNYRQLQKNSHQYGLAIKSLKIIAGLVIIFAIVFNFFLVTEESETESNFLSSQNPVTEFREIDQSQLKTLEELPQDLGTSVSPDDEYSLAPSEDLSTELDTNFPISEQPIVTANSTHLESLVDTESLIESKQLDLENTFDTSTVNSKIETQPFDNKDSLSVNPDPTPQWILEGLVHFKTGSLEKALFYWKKGFDSLENNTQLFSIMINYNPDLARKIINNLLEKNYPVFTVIAKFKGKKAYYTMALPAQNSLETAKKAVIEQLGIEPFIINKSAMNKRITALEKPNPRKEKTVKSIDIEKLISDAEQAVYQGQYKKAQKILNPHLRKNTTNWKLLFWLGSAELGQRNLQRADKLFLQAQSINPDVAQVWTQRALIAQERNDHASALVFLNKAKTLAPKTPEIILNIAYSQEALENTNGAAYSYREFLSLTNGISGYEDLIQSAEMRLNDLVYKK